MHKIASYLTTPHSPSLPPKNVLILYHFSSNSNIKQHFDQIHSFIFPLIFFFSSVFDVSMFYIYINKHKLTHKLLLLLHHFMLKPSKKNTHNHNAFCSLDDFVRRKNFLHSVVPYNWVFSRISKQKHMTNKNKKVFHIKHLFFCCSELPFE